MSIDAIIEDVTYNKDGTANLELKPRDSEHAPAGQRRLTVLNPPHGDLLASAIGLSIWGDSCSILIRDTVWAKREGYGSIRLLSKEHK